MRTTERTTHTVGTAEVFLDESPDVDNGFGYVDRYHHPVYVDQKVVARVLFTRSKRDSYLYPLESEGIENARRFVAAWNACEGISTETLERSTLQGLMWGLFGALRDAVNIIDGTPCPIDDADEWRRDVILRATHALQDTEGILNQPQGGGE